MYKPVSNKLLGILFYIYVLQICFRSYRFFINIVYYVDLDGMYIFTFVRDKITGTESCIFN